MRHARLGLAMVAGLMALGMGGSLAVAQEDAVPKLTKREAKPGDDELRKALIERYNAAVELVEANRAFFDQGLITIDRVVDGTAKAARAELDLCETAAEEVKVWETIVALARGTEAREKARLDIGSGSRPNLLEARYSRLDAEVQLLKAKKAAEAK